MTVVVRFGVCCVFTVDECGDEASHNSTYIRNPGFPSDYEATDACSYKISKVDEGENETNMLEHNNIALV